MKRSIPSGRVWLWRVGDLARPIELGQPLTNSGDAVASITFSPDGRTLAGAGNIETPSNTASNTVGRVWLWNLAHPDNASQLGQPLMAENAANFAWMAFSPDGKTLAVRSRDHTIKLWDVALIEKKDKSANRG